MNNTSLKKDDPIVTVKELEELRNELKEVVGTLHSVTKSQQAHNYASSIQEGLVVPLTENPLARISGKLIFHSTTGRFLMKGVVKFTVIMDMCLSWLLSQRIGVLIQIYLDRLEAITPGDTVISNNTNTVWVLFLLTYFVSAFSATVSQGIISQMGDDNILEESEQSKMLRALKDVKFQREVALLLKQLQ